MMAAEGPFVAAVIARLADPKENLAAFAVASALAWIVESPIIMMLSASNALVRDGLAYRKLRRFSMALNAAVTVVMAVLIVPPVFDLVARGGMGLTPVVAGLAGRSMVFLVLWPGAIGFRRFYQGILINDGRPQAVTWGTVIRLSTMAATGLAFALVLRLPGASVGAGALGAGVIAEAAASWVMARPTVRRLRRQPDEECAFGRSLTQAQGRPVLCAARADLDHVLLHQSPDDLLPGPRPHAARIAGRPARRHRPGLRLPDGGHRHAGGRHRAGRGRPGESPRPGPVHLADGSGRLRPARPGRVHAAGRRLVRRRSRGSPRTWPPSLFCRAPCSSSSPSSNPFCPTSAASSSALTGRPPSASPSPSSSR